jgi:hypothetical protein
MIDASTRGTHDLEIIIHKLKQENILLKKELKAKELKIQKLKELKNDQYNELGY